MINAREYDLNRRALDILDTNSHNITECVEFSENVKVFKYEDSDLSVTDILAAIKAGKEVVMTRDRTSGNETITDYFRFAGYSKGNGSTCVVYFVETVVTLVGSGLSPSVTIKGVYVNDTGKSYVEKTLT